MTDTSSLTSPVQFKVEKIPYTPFIEPGDWTKRDNYPPGLNGVMEGINLLLISGPGDIGKLTLAKKLFNFMHCNTQVVFYDRTDKYHPDPLKDNVILYCTIFPSRDVINNLLIDAKRVIVVYKGSPTEGMYKNIVSGLSCNTRWLKLDKQPYLPEEPKFNHEIYQLE